eukprot:4344172-Amphidinium_carterae.1
MDCGTFDDLLLISLVLTAQLPPVLECLETLARSFGAARLEGAADAPLSDKRLKKAIEVQFLQLEIVPATTKTTTAT